MTQDEIKSMVTIRVDALLYELGVQCLGEDLHAEGWHLVWKNTYRVLGSCCFDRREIALSLPMCLEFCEPGCVSHEVEDTIRHEIAHAVDFHRRRQSPHDKVWKAVAVECGANPNRLASFQLPRRYRIVCVDCGEQWSDNWKPNVKRIFCPTCNDYRDVLVVDSRAGSSKPLDKIASFE